jgi:capsular exopolysaccharide synthesis family protein
MKNDKFRNGLPRNRELTVRKEEVPAEPIPYTQPQFFQEEAIDFRDYLAVILRRKWTIFAIFMIIVVTVGIHTFRLKPLYRASATVEVNTTQPEMTPFGNQWQGRIYDQGRYLKTQADILKSRTLAMRVVEVLDLENHPEFNPKPEEESSFSLSKLIGYLLSLFPSSEDEKSNGSKETVVDPEEYKRYSLSDMVAADIRVKAYTKYGEGSYILDVSYQSHDPKLCADVVNTLISEYVKFDLEKRIQATKLGHRYLQKQIEKVQAKLEAAEDKLNKFAKEHDIVYLSQVGRRNDNGRDIATAQLESLSEQLNQAKAKRIELESLYRQSLKNPDNIPQVVENDLVKNLKEELAKLEKNYAELSSVFTPKYPKLKRIRSEIKSLKKQIAKEKRLIISTIKSRYSTAVKNEEMLQEALNQQKKKVARLKRMAVDYKILKREVETNQQIYELLLQKSKELDVEVGIKSSNIHPIDKALVPMFPFKPNRFKNMVLAIFMGLFCGVFGAFVIEYFDNTFKSPEEVERYLGLPILGTIPHISLKKVSEEEEKSIELEALQNPRSAAAEAFRMIRTSLMLSAAGSPPKCLLVTAPQAGNGKSFVCFNLGLVYAQMGARVLILDCDLRKPRLHKLLKTSSNPGLSNFLSGKMDLKTITKSVGENLDRKLKIDFIPSGAMPPNPVELLNSQIFSDTLGRLRDVYDIIIIDSPPVVGFADSLVLSRVADGTMLIVRNEQTPRPMSQHCCELLFQVDAKLLGVVVNDIKLRKGTYYYGKYYSYYHYYYGKYYSDDGKPELTGRVA